MNKPIVFEWPEDTLVVGVDPYLDGKVFVCGWDDEYIVDFAEQSVVSAPFYTREFVPFRDGRGWVKDKKIWRLLDGKGNEIKTLNDVRYAPGGPFSGGYCQIFERRTSLFGVMDREGKMPLAALYRRIGRFDSGFAKALDHFGDYDCMINGEGAEVYKSDADEMSDVYGGRCLEVWWANGVHKNDRIRLIECTPHGVRKLGEMEAPHFKHVDEWRGGDLIPYDNGARRDRQEGLVNIASGTRTDALWKQAMFEREGFSRVSDKGSVYFVDAAFKKLSETGWQEAMDFSEGLAAVQDEKQKWGYIDRTGRLAIEPQFEKADRFVDGFALVMREGKYMLVNRAGEACTQAFDKLMRIVPEHHYIVAEKDKKQYIISAA